MMAQRYPSIMGNIGSSTVVSLHRSNSHYLGYMQVNNPLDACFGAVMLVDKFRVNLSCWVVGL